MIKRSIAFEQAELEDHIAIAAFIFDEQQRLLTFKHHKWGFWTIPVGKAEKGETAEQALRREMEEELGISKYEATKLYDVNAHYLRNGITLVTNLVAFELKQLLDTPVNKEPDIHSSFGYRTIDELLKKSQLSDQLMLYLDQQGIKHTQTMEAKLIA